MGALKKIKLTEKELEVLKTSATEFLLNDIEALKIFVKKVKEDFGQDDLLFALKMYILSCNKVFNSKLFMEKQSAFVADYVKSNNKNLTTEQRRDAFNCWVKENAEDYRKEAIFNQIEILDKMESYIIPLIEQELKKGN
jgi:hypothetical protein